MHDHDDAGNDPTGRPDSLPGPTSPPPGSPHLTGWDGSTGPVQDHGRRPRRLRLAIAATAAFALGCGVAGGVAGVLVHSSGESGSGTTTTPGTQSAGWANPGTGPGSGSDSSGQGGAADGSGGLSQYPQFGLGGGYGYPGGSAGNAGSGAGSGAGSSTTSDASAAQSAGLVEITSTLNTGIAAGTGMVISSDGTIVTNHHVVAGATAVKVTVVATQKSYTATYVGGDATTDVAVLRLQGASGLATVTLSDTAAAAGDQITAVGDAGGDGGSLSASPGTVAALGADIEVSNDDGTRSPLTDLVQLDAALVGGDSGGAVLDAHGDVVAMNVAASSGGTSVAGYAIPVATVETLAQQILAGRTGANLTYGYSGYLGVGLVPTSAAAEVAEALDGGAAAKAGLAAGDVITSFDGTAISTASQLQEIVGSTSAGERAALTWQTASGSSKSATVTLGQGGIA